MAFNLTYKPFGERSILVEWPEVIDEKVLVDIIKFKTHIEQKNIKYIIEIKSAYNSLLIIYDSICRNFKNEVINLKKIYKSVKTNSDTVSVLWKIPVCYDDEFGVDLHAISVEKNLSKEQVVKLHSQALYTVYFIGFLPGFLYLGGLNESLFMPRKPTPRLQIEKGAVAIGGHQTGVYPMASPGGWNIIGNSPVDFFNPKLNPPCFVNAGDKIVFNPISFKEYTNIKTLVQAGVYIIESEALHG